MIDIKSAPDRKVIVIKKSLKQFMKQFLHKLYCLFVDAEQTKISPTSSKLTAGW